MTAQPPYRACGRCGAIADTWPAPGWTVQVSTRGLPKRLCPRCSDAAATNASSEQS